MNDYRACARAGFSNEEENKSSFMWDHITAVHGGDRDVNPEEVFKFKVIAAFKDPLTRQVTEAVKIQRAQY